MSFLGNVVIHGFYYYILYKMFPERRVIRDGVIVGFIAGGLLVILNEPINPIFSYLSDTLSRPILFIINSIYEEGIKILFIFTYYLRFSNNDEHLRFFGASMGISYAFMETTFLFESSIIRGVLPVLLHAITCFIISDGVKNYNLDKKISWLLASYLFAVIFHTGYNAYVNLSWIRFLDRFEEWSTNLTGFI